MINTPPARWTLILLSTIICAGCATVGAPSVNPQKPSALSQQKNVAYSTAVSMGRCPITRGESGIGGLAFAAATALIGPVMDYVGKSADEASKVRIDSSFASRSMELGPNQLQACITVARGWFYTSVDDTDPDKTVGQNPELWPKALEAAPPSRWYGAGLPVAAFPDFYFVGKILKRGEKYIILPYQVALYRPLSQSSVRPSSRKIAIVFGFTGDRKAVVGDAGKVVDIAPSDGTVVELPYLDIGKEFEYLPDQCTSVGGAWTAVTVQCSRAPAGVLYEIGASRPFQMPGFQPNMPFSVDVGVFETADGSKIAGLIGSLLTNSSVQGYATSTVKSLGDGAAKEK